MYVAVIPAGIRCLDPTTRASRVSHPTPIRSVIAQVVARPTLRGDAA